MDELLQSLYEEGLKQSKHLSDNEIKKILTNIGMFKFKGYCYAFKGIA
jgi:ribonuclease HIII